MDDRLGEIRETFGVAEVAWAVGWPGYAVSRCGRVFSFRHNPGDPGTTLRELRPNVGMPRPRLSVCLGTGGGKRARRYVAKLVAAAFLPPPGEGQNVLRHLDDNPRNNRAENLAWGTAIDNAADARRNGRIPDTRGIRFGPTKLNGLAVERIITVRDSLGLKFKEIGRWFGVSANAAADAYHGDTWANVGVKGNDSRFR
jgi:hypothetical protein